MILQNESINEDEEICDDGFCDINNEASPDIEEEEKDLKSANKFQKFIKKISQPS